MSTEAPLTVSPCCLKGAVLAGEPKGTNETIAGLDTYIARPEKVKDATKVIVIATDVFGVAIPNPKLIADILATSTGLVVYVPDFLEGDYAPLAKMSLVEEPLAGKPFFTRVLAMTKMIGSFVLFVGPAFMIRHRPGVMVPLAEKFCAELRAERGVTRIGMVGYCLGGTLTVKIAPTDAVDVLITCHPGTVKPSDFEGTRQPHAMILAQEDLIFDPVKTASLAILARKNTEGIPTAIYDHPGTTHGFACRPEVKIPIIAAAFEKAMEQKVNWFNAHL